MKPNKFGFLVEAGLAVLAACLFPGMTGCENRAYREAERQNTRESYQDFLKRYPEGKKQKSAGGHIAQLQFDAAMKQNTIPALQDFIRDCPDCVTTPTARRVLAQLAEVEAGKLSNEQIAQTRAVIKTDLGGVTLELFPDKAPETCRNFIKLARELFYDGTEFSFIVPGVLVQGGAPGGDPRGGPGYTIKGEVNDLPNDTGAAGMALRDQPDSAGSQFYILLRRLPERDGKYTVFARVIEGIEIVEGISGQESSGPRGEPYPFKPLRPILIKTIEIIQAKQ